MTGRRGVIGMLAGAVGALFAQQARAIDDVQIVQSGSNTVTNSGNETNVQQTTQQILNQQEVVQQVGGTCIDGLLRFHAGEGGTPSCFQIQYDCEWHPFDMCSFTRCYG